MADIINLRQARKIKIRKDKADIASANRTKFGRSKGEKNLTNLSNTMSKEELDGKKLED